MKQTTVLIGKDTSETLRDLKHIFKVESKDEVIKKLFVLAKLKI